MDVEMPKLTPEQLSVRVDSAIDYIEKLQLPPPPLRSERGLLSAAPSEKTPCAIINDKQVICFEKGFPPQLRDDVLNSTLFAQLAATKLYPDDASAWYKMYEEVLKKIGWAVQESSFSDYTIKGDMLEVDKALIEVLEGLLLPSNQIKAIVTAAMESLTQLKSKDPAKFNLFRRNALSNGQGGFGMGACTEVDGIAYTSLGAFHLYSEVKTDDYLWFHYHTKKSRVFKATSNMILNPQIYNDLIRDAVLKKLKEAAEEYVTNLDIDI